VLVPDRKAVRELLTRYASLRIAQAEGHMPTAARELEDVSYTLCVMMGTSAIHEAIAKADALLLTKGPSQAAEADGESGLTLVG
jgi:DNA-binding FrmR family transcriptional regulator